MFNSLYSFILEVILGCPTDSSLTHVQGFPTEDSYHIMIGFDPSL